MNTPSLNGNWVDLIVILVFAFFIFDARKHKFWDLLADFLAFLGSLIVALRGYQFIAGILRSNFSLIRPVSNALGFLLTAIIVEAILGFLFRFLARNLPSKLLDNKTNKLLSPIPALGEALVLTSFVLTILLGFPVSPHLKNDITSSRIGGFIVEKTSGIESSLNEVFGGVIEDSLTYFTVRPGSQESVPLAVESDQLVVDEQSESRMLGLVNEERRKAGVPELTPDPEIALVARSHAWDMWERKYFGHISPDGEDVGVRLGKAKINYSIAGENLALAPTVQTAQSGLMSSEGHRANILEPGFRKVGIGVIDNGYYGKMFVQVFTD